MSPCLAPPNFTADRVPLNEESGVDTDAGVNRGDGDPAPGTTPLSSDSGSSAIYCLSIFGFGVSHALLGNLPKRESRTRV